MRAVMRLVVVGILLGVLILMVWSRIAARFGTREQIKLPEPRAEGGLSVEAAIAARRSVREFDPRPLSWAEIGQLAWAAQGITDPVRRLRAAPSAGALYPLELYFATPDGLYHYLPDGHRMERLGARDRRRDLQEAVVGEEVGPAPLVIVISAVLERTAQKYRSRAERYVCLEVGHVGENLQLQAVALGLGSVPIGGFREEQVAKALGLPQGRQPLYLIPVGYPKTTPSSR